MTPESSILHVDMDAFFASVELTRHPQLRGRPVIVGGTQRSVVLAATYEARAYGVHSALPMATARRLCPQAVVIPPDHQAYRRVSAGVMKILGDVTPVLEQISVDEAFLDVSGARRRLGGPQEIAELIRRRVREEFEVTCSVGIATTKSVAKIASGRAKPDGVLYIPPEATVSFLHQLPVRALWGVGAKTADKLAQWGIGTVGELAALPRDRLQRALGRAAGAHLHELAWGRDPRPVNPVREEKSCGAETTFPVDVTDPSELVRTLLRLGTQIGHRLRTQGLVGRTISLKLRTADFSTWTRSRTLEVPTDVSGVIFDTANELLAAAGVEQPVRLVGIRVEQLSPAHETAIQDSFDDLDLERRETDKAMDEVKDRFGSGSLTRATLLPTPATSEHAPAHIS